VIYYAVNAVKWDGEKIQGGVLDFGFWSGNGGWWLDGW
jgi:hypothetical protein